MDSLSRKEIMAVPASKKQVVRPSSPEQLDRLVTITTPVGWVSLLGLCLIIGAVVVWSFFGSIPTKVQGIGILVREGGVLNIVTTGAGVVTELLVGPGDKVQEGQVVARVLQSDLEAQVESAKREVEIYTNEWNHSKEVLARESKLREQSFLKQRQNLKALLKDLSEREHWLNERSRAQKELVSKGLLAEQVLINTKEDLQSTLGDQRKAMVQLAEIDRQELQSKNQQEQTLFNKELQAVQAKEKLQLLNEQLEYRSLIKSNFSGHVFATMVRAGAQVGVGDLLMSVEPLERKLNAIIYVPATHGKKVTKDMEIQLVPSTVKRDEFGYILGKVIGVSPYPATPEHMMSILGNKELVAQFTHTGAPIAVEVHLMENLQTISGFQWSSRKGPPFKITTGTICSADVVVREQAPITLVVPFLRHLTGIHVRY